MLWKEFVQLRRDRLTLGMMLGMPAIQLALFGFAIRTEVRHLPTVVLDESRTPESRALVEAFANSGNFDIIGTCRDRAELAPADRARPGERGARHPARTSSADIKRGRGAGAGDRRRRGSARVLRGDLRRRPGRHRPRRRHRAGRGGGRARADVRVRPWYNPGLRSAVYIVPGIVGVLLTLTLVLITSMAIVRERERGTLEQLIVTPIDKTSLMLGKILPFVLIGYVQITVILLLGRLLFDVPMRGSLPLLYLLSLAVHRREPRARAVHVDGGADPGAGDAAQLPLHPAEHPAVGLHVSRARRCRRWRSGSAPRCRSPTSSRFCAACCSRAPGSPRSGRRRSRSSGFAVGLVVLSVARFHKTIE